MKLVRATSTNKDFEDLVIQLDAYLKVIDGDDHAFYTQFNKTSMLKNAVICYENEIAVGIGAYKEYDAQTAEIKRMFTLPEYRGKGIAKAILLELENWASEEKYATAILETGYLQTDAISLYKKMGYTVIPNYGQYTGVETSVCMKKAL
jgi:putative acetyltransferase